MSDDHNDRVRKVYSRRAPNYDTSHGGWHIELANEFVRWIDPKPGEKVLDLACGTGLVSIPMAREVGSTGKVVGVDLTTEMIDVGKESASSLSGDAASIDWLTADITSETLLEAASIKEVLLQNGGF